ncbi:hypothetical protein AS200_14845 [Streptomyces sp. CdTB01]|nr:hypothetical protein AS200_14845 [Streptomyces sp. CdTB01]
MIWYDHNMSGWGWFGAGLGMIAFWALIITAFVVIYRALTRPGDRIDTPPWAPPAPSSPEQLLAERFARGEIDEEEYQRRLRVLHSSGPDLAKH